MGNLLKETPHSETNATLEVLDRFGVSRAHLERIRANNGEFGEAVAEFIRAGGWAKPQTDIAAALQKLSRFYREVFGRQVDASSLPMPTARGDINFPLVMAQGLTPQALFEKCRERFGAWKWCDGDLEATSDRDPRKGAYIVLVRLRVEADEEHAGKSAQVLAGIGITGITLEERLMLELFYHWDTGGHLDLRNWTLCLGSRFSGGSVPFVVWCDDRGRLDVYYISPGSYFARLRAREVVSAG